MIRVAQFCFISVLLLLYSGCGKQPAAAPASSVNDVKGWDKIKWGMKFSDAHRLYSGRIAQRIERSPEGKLIALPVLEMEEVRIGKIGAKLEMQRAASDGAINLIVLSINRQEVKASDDLAFGFIFGELESLLTIKYGAAAQRYDKEVGEWAFRKRVWLFPSTQISLTTDAHGLASPYGWVRLAYEPVDQSALDLL